MRLRATCADIQMAVLVINFCTVPHIRTVILARAKGDELLVFFVLPDGRFEKVPCSPFPKVEDGGQYHEPVTA